MAEVHIADYKIYLDSAPIPLIGGEVHYWRLAPQNWRGILERARQMGLEVISTYVCWDFHQLTPGINAPATFDFSGESDPRRNLTGFLDLAEVLGRLQDRQRTGMTQNMWRNSFCQERGRALCGGRDMFAQNVFEAGTGHWLATSIEEQFRYRDFTPNRQPRTQCRCGFLPQGQATFPTSFSMDEHSGLRLKFQIVKSKSDEFRDAYTPSEAQVKHGAIAYALPVSGFRGIEDGLHFSVCEVLDEAGIGLLCRDCENPLDLFDGRRETIFHEVHERLDRRQSNVSRSGAISAGCFQMIQELHHERGIDVLQLKL